MEQLQLTQNVLGGSPRTAGSEATDIGNCSLRRCGRFNRRRRFSEWFRYMCFALLCISQQAQNVRYKIEAASNNQRAVVSQLACLLQGMKHVMSVGCISVRTHTSVGGWQNGYLQNDLQDVLHYHAGPDPWQLGLTL